MTTLTTTKITFIVLAEQGVLVPREPLSPSSQVTIPAKPENWCKFSEKRINLSTRNSLKWQDMAEAEAIRVTATVVVVVVVVAEVFPIQYLPS